MNGDLPDVRQVRELSCEALPPRTIGSSPMAKRWTVSGMWRRRVKASESVTSFKN